MLPAGFKKDSRVWLHKNSHVFPKKILTNECFNQQQRLGKDDPYDLPPDDSYVNPPPILTDTTTGRVFKKDSRTWLHKSSVKILAKAVTQGAIRIASNVKPTWRPQNVEKSNLSGGETFEENLVRTRSSTEMIRAQTGAFKVKKKKKAGLYPDETFVTTLDFRSVKEVSATRPTKQHGASYHAMTGKAKGNLEVSAYASDFCIVGSKSPHKVNVSSSSETENDVDDDDDEGDNRDDYLKTDKGNCASYPLTGVDDNNRTCVGMGCNNSTVEITKDGLRELERMMKEQHWKRSGRFTSHHVDENGIAHEVSPETQSSESKASLDACVDLSDEVNMKTSQCEKSTEQLTQATEYLHVRSPNQSGPQDLSCFVEEL